MLPTTNYDDEIDLNNIDYDWVQKTDKPKLLKKGLKILMKDGNLVYFRQLLPPTYLSN